MADSKEIGNQQPYPASRTKDLAAYKLVIVYIIV